MKPKEHKRRYWIVRVFCPDMNGDFYLYDARGYGQRRDWWLAVSFEKAYQFHNRGDARAGARSKCIKDKIKDEPGDWFWEVVEITETITTTYETVPVCGDAPAMVQLARAVS